MSLPVRPRWQLLFRLSVVTLSLLALGNFSRADSAYPKQQSLATVGPISQPISKVELRSAEKLMFANFSPGKTAPGIVIASPSKTKPDYYYRWIRDEALVMNVVLDLAKANPDKAPKYLSYLYHYVNRTKEAQSSNALTGLGEPKFNVDGTPFGQDWMRPQYDGPALRILTLTNFANYQLTHNGEKGEKYVRSQLYSGLLPASSVIKRDAEHVAYNWQHPGFDLWEETWGFHFYTLLVQRSSLLEAAQLADRLGDVKAADFYRMQAGLMRAKLKKFWDPERGYVLSFLGEHWQPSPQKDLDTAVILGVLHANRPASEAYGVLDPRIQATAEKLRSRFAREYAVNRDPQYAHLGVAIGRYPLDPYDGVEKVEGKTKGNPWYLTTSAMAEYYYKVADAYRAQGRIIINNINREFFAWLDPDIAKTAYLGDKIVIHSDSPEFNLIIAALIHAGDRFMARVRFHREQNQNHMAEQFNRESGVQQGARDLTWSYAAFVTAAMARPASAKFDRPSETLACPTAF